VTSIPRHIAFIMDGNGRWAEALGMPRIEGHRRGADTVRTVTETCAALGVEAITLYCLSSENWKRPSDELNFLMELLQQYLVQQRSTLVQENIRLEVIGRRDRLPTTVLQEMETTIAGSASHTGMRLVLAIDYGGRAEILSATKRIAAQVAAGSLLLDEIDEQVFRQQLYLPDLPDPDLLIRTGGEQRVSNYLLWQISYTELWVTPKCWPEFTAADCQQAIADFGVRQRRFGGLNNDKY
jgi:undecaprenyl diphosphate synthase